MAKLSPWGALPASITQRLNYQRLDSLQNYVLVAQDEPLVEVYQRQPDSWIYTRYGNGETVKLSSIDMSFAIGAIYEDVIR